METVIPLRDVPVEEWAQRHRDAGHHPDADLDGQARRLPGSVADHQREYWVQPVADSSWWAVTCSADVTRRRLIGSREGAILLAQSWETETG